MAEAIRSQEPDGYLGMLIPASRMWELWDIHEMGYLIYGLTSDFRFFGEKDSHAVYFLNQQEVSRLDVVNYISHGVAKIGQESNPQQGPEAGKEGEGGDEPRGNPLTEFASNLNDLARQGILDDLGAAARWYSAHFEEQQARAGCLQYGWNVRWRSFDSRVPNSLRSLRVMCVRRAKVPPGHSRHNASRPEPPRFLRSQ